jgi:metalloendopeptidase OMA1, mitochondrial
MKSVKFFLNSCGLALLVCGASSCLERNAAGRQTLLLESSRELEQQSGAIYAEQIAKGKLSTNTRYNAIVQRSGKRIIEQAQKLYPEHCQGFQWEVNLLESDEANAYCMPGGKIAVYTGILKVCENEAALAAVMGHEVSHALLDHGNERMSQAKMAAGVMAVAQVASETAIKDEKYKQGALMALGLGAQVGVLLPFSRTHETEADRMGLRLSAAAGYDPAEAPRLWERMKQLGGGAPLEFMSTHPGHDRRIQDLQDMQPQVLPLYQKSVKVGIGERF